MIEGVELTWWDENGGNSIPLEQWQLWAIHQILGLQIIKDAKGYQISYFGEETVKNRIKKAGILVEK